MDNTWKCISFGSRACTLVVADPEPPEGQGCEQAPQAHQGRQEGGKDRQAKGVWLIQEEQRGIIVQEDRWDYKSEGAPHPVRVDVRRITDHLVPAIGKDVDHLQSFYCPEGEGSAGDEQPTEEAYQAGENDRQIKDLRGRPVDL